MLVSEGFEIQAPCATILKAVDGSLVATHREFLSVQQSFVCDRHAAKAIQPCELQQKAQAAALALANTPMCCEALPSPVEIKGIFAKTRPFKSHGTDLLPPDLLRRCSAQLSLLCWPLYLKAAVWFYEPLQWRGGEACFFPHPKAKSGNATFDALREIALSSAIGKAWHRLIRRKASRCTDPLLLDTQFGGIAKRSTDFATAYVRVQLAAIRARRQSAATVFLDVVAAFCQMIREGIFVLPRTREEWLQFLAHAQWHPLDAQNLLSLLGRPIYDIAQSLPENLQAVAAAAHSATWLLPRRCRDVISDRDLCNHRWARGSAV